jgi:hypothetical protein
MATDEFVVVLLLLLLVAVVAVQLLALALAPRRCRPERSHEPEPSAQRPHRHPHPRCVSSSSSVKIVAGRETEAGRFPVVSPLDAEPAGDKATPWRARARAKARSGQGGERVAEGGNLNQLDNQTAVHEREP